MATLTLDVPLNRVEGDLEVRIEARDGVVADAWCTGTLFRDFETVLVGRGHLDGLVITPRICGICSTAHLLAAVRALEDVAGLQPPPDAIRLRNVVMAAEAVQSDARHAFLMFAVDLASPVHAGRSFHDEAVRRYTAVVGQSARHVLAATRDLVEVIQFVGGRWPHSSYMVPGGLTQGPARHELQQIRLLVESARRWYERHVLGCPCERWQAVDSAEGLDAWLAEAPAHSDSELGFFVRAAREAGLDRIASARRNFLSYGGYPAPEGGTGRGAWLAPPGFARGGRLEPLNEPCITEHLAHSWLVGDESPVSPARGTTKPYATGHENDRYSWAKAPRYDGLPAETGPLAEAVFRGDPLLVDLLRRQGPSPFVRHLARIGRGALLLPAMQRWLADVTPRGECYLAPRAPFPDGAGFGGVQAARGALGHWVRIRDERIEHYQIVSPTTWNASPRDDNGARGPIEEALIGVPLSDPAHPVEAAHVVRSFDPCLVCTVH